MDIFPKPDIEAGHLKTGNRRGKGLGPGGLVGLLGVLLWGPLAAETPVRFAEELFPELGALMERAAIASTELQLRELRIEERAGDLDVAVGQRRPSARLHGRVIGSYETRDPEIVLPNPEGEEIALSSLRGKAVLLHFWSAQDR
ncbi:MAG: hypothetical protein R6V45_12115, partial [Oceanipulchritudo sp.]